MAMEGADAGALHDPNYTRALEAVQEFLDLEDRGMPLAEIQRMDARLREMAGAPMDAAAIITPGTPWGALEELRLAAAAAGGRVPSAHAASGHRLANATPFAYPGWQDAPEARPWVELLEDGEFSSATLALAVPPSFQTDGPWLVLVSRSRSSWLRSLLLGIAEAEHAGGQAQQQPDFAAARASFAQSYALQPNPVAARCMAVSAPTATQAATNFSTAWALALALPAAQPRREELMVALAAEICSFYLGLLPSSALPSGVAGRELDNFLRSINDGDAVPAAVKHSDNVLFASATRAMDHGNCTAARAIISSSRFPTFFSGPRTQLASIWATCAAMDEEARLGRPLTSVDRHRVRVGTSAQAPANIGPFAGTILPH